MDNKTLIQAGIILTSYFIVPKILKSISNKAQGSILSNINTTIRDLKTNNASDPNYFEGMARKLKESSGLQDVPHVVIPGYKNGAFIPPGSIDEYKYAPLQDEAKILINSKNKADNAYGQFILKSLEYSKMPNGGIVIGNSMDDPAILAHELGHAKIHRDKTIDSYIPQVSNILGTLGLPIATAGLISKIFYKNQANNIFWTGMGTFGLSQIGKLYNEYNASKIGKEMFNGTIEPKRNNILNLALVQRPIGGAKKGLDNISNFSAMDFIQGM